MSNMILAGEVRTVPGRLADIFLDFVPRLALVAWFGWQARLKILALAAWFRTTDVASLSLQSVAAMLPNLGLLVFTLVVVVLAVVRRRQLSAAAGIYPRAVAFLGTFFVPVIFWLPQRHDMSLGLSLTASALMFAGGLGSAIVVIWLGRSFSIMPEARRLVVNGPYRFVRHPLYLVEEILIVGVLISFAPPWCYLAIVTHGLLQLERMRLEEGVLRRCFPDYAAYAARTARIIPGLF